MGTNLNLTSSVLVKNVGKNGQGESLDAGASLSIKRKINDVTYNARITEATVMNVGSFKGAWLQLAKPLGPTLTGILTYDLGIKAFTAQLLNSQKFEGGRQLDLGILYKERNNEVVLSAAGKPHKQHRLNAMLVPSTKALQGAYLFEHGPWSLQPSYDFTKKAAVIGISRKLPKSSIAFNYAVKDKGAALSWTRKPFTLLAKHKIGREGLVGKPHFGVTFSTDFLLRDAPIRKAAGTSRRT